MGQNGHFIFQNCEGILSQANYHQWVLVKPLSLSKQAMVITDAMEQSPSSAREEISLLLWNPSHGALI
jgi:hypothetical protein